MTTDPHTPIDPGRPDLSADISAHISAFVDRYAAALLARDAAAIAELYAVPALILFPGQSIPVTSRAQTEQFFAAAFAQYDGVDDLERSVSVMGTGPGTAWVDITWTYRSHPSERFCYQLVATDAAGTPCRIAVLTPLDVPDQR